ncbi:hypothetical protein DB354_07985 [Opitutus sp. ER46]|nr:hypothetical protein DB354_07985 [Opitutus sp. ER46]
MALVVLVASYVPGAVAQYYYPSVASAELVSPGPFSPGQEVKVRFTLNAGSYAADRVAFILQAADGSNDRTVISTDPASGLAAETVSRFWRNTIYSVKTISVSDAAGGNAAYDASGAISIRDNDWFLPGEGPRAALTLAFAVTGAGERPAMPRLDIAQVSPGEIKAGDPLVWSYTATPGVGDDWRFDLQIMGPNSINIFTRAAAGKGTASGTYSYPTTPNWVNGTYKVYYTCWGNENGSAGGLVGSFVITGGAERMTLPQLKSIAVSGHGPFGLNDTISMACTVDPGSVALKSGTAVYSGPSRFELRLAADGTGSFQVQPQTVDGLYTLAGVSLTNIFGFTVRYVRSGDMLEPRSNFDSTLPWIPYPNADVTVADVLKIPPVITRQPEGGTVQPGATKTLSVEYFGPVAAVQWYQGKRGDTSNPVGDLSTFTPQPPTDTTSYWARVTTMYGSVDSDAATLTVLFSSPLPVILLQPEGCRLPAGISWRLNFRAYGPGPLSYQWYKDDTAVAGATATLLVLNPGKLADSGQYKAVITNPNGSATSNAVSVLFYEQPTITLQPVNTSVALGGTATLSVSATGGDLKYEWDYVGKTSYPFVLTDDHLSTLTLTNVQPYMAGAYQVRVFNDAGRVDSVPVTLTVTNVPVPEFAAIATQYGQIGMPVSIRARATNYPTRYVATGLPAGLAIDPASGDITGTPTASGTFPVTVSAINAGGTGTRTFDLIVAPATYGPTIIEQPVSVTPPLYTSATLSITAVGTPMTWLHSLGYQWFHDGVAITGQDVWPTCTVWADSPAKSGDYWVVVTGAGGSVKSAVVRLEVDTTRSAPRITSILAPESAVAGSTVTFAAAVTGSPAPTYQWWRDETAIAGATDATLTLANVSAADASGGYRLYLSNAHGTCWSTRMGLQVSYAVTPAAVSVRPGTSATLSVPASAAVTYQWYQGERGDTSRPIAGATAASYTTPPLLATTSYWVKVSGFGFIYSSTATVTVTEAPANFGGSYSGTFSDGGNWVMVIGTDNRGTFLGYGTQPARAIAGTVTVAADGSFTVTPSASTATSVSGAAVRALTTEATAAVSGQIGAGGGVSGGAMGLTGTLDSGTSGVALSGLHHVTALAGASGGADILVGASGKAVIVVTTPAGVVGAAGTLGANGTLSVKTAAGETLSVALDGSSKRATLALQDTAGARTEFGGLVAGATNTSRLMNLSARARVDGSSDLAIVGFTTSGAAAKNLLIRGVGPSLAQLQLPGFLKVPAMTLYDGRSNPMWSGLRYGSAAAITDTAQRLGAFPLLPVALDCAYLGPIEGGSHTAILSGKDVENGICLAEVYDADTAATGERLVNLSARAKTASGIDVLSAGFVISGNGPLTVLLRGVGPGLKVFSLSGLLAQPKLVLFNAAGQELTSNAGWGGDAALERAFKTTMAFGLAPDSADAALLVTLTPGLYTAQVQSKDGAAGLALIEIYEVK